MPRLFVTVRILVGDCRQLLRGVRDESMHCAITSPPYFGLRDYGTATWQGGDPSCEHRGREKPRQDTSSAGADHGAFAKTRGNQPAKSVFTIPVRDVCRCGAQRIDAQIGLERTPEEYVANLVEVFREVRRALRDDGTLWLNLGDSYATGAGSVGEHPGGGEQGERWKGGRRSSTGEHEGKHAYLSDRGVGPLTQPNRMPLPGLKPKDLIGIPWRVAFALQADGWYLRSDIIWSKPNPMPESVADRPTKSHEYLFLLSKSPRYYYDADAIAEPLAAATMRDSRSNEDGVRADRGYPGAASNGGTRLGVSRSGNKERKYRADHGGPAGARGHQGHAVPWASDGSHRPQYQRALEIARERGLTDAHLEAIRTCGFFGDSATKTRLTQNGTANEAMLALAREAKEVLGGYYREFLQAPTRNRRSVWTVTTRPFREAHFATFPPELIEPCVLAGTPPGGVVLDPFGGAGTTGLVADRLGRNAVLIELNRQYADLADRRIHNDAPLLAGLRAEEE